MFHRKSQRVIKESQYEREPSADKPTTSERMIVLLMRVTGTAGLLALTAVVAPHAWMNAVHESIGLGNLPDLPIVSYLTRSLSLFFSLLGGLTLYIASDIRQHRKMVAVWAVVFATLGVVRVGIDLVSGMPPWWTLLEGPPVIALAVIVLVLLRRS